MRIILLLLLSVFAVNMQSQNIVKSLERYVPGQGKVTIHQDPRIEALLGTEHKVGGDQTVLKSSGYRVQVYAGNNSRAARSEATHVASKVNEYFPDLKTYTFFTSPRWLCRVGDFRSIEEADAMMRKLRATGIFREVSIVKDQINIPL
ncbi:SPOR domain-containing protein [Oscillospiraceae bacterium N12]|jgi:hypothetical protein|uniref:SPOR domain-containing protein n=1 Tax=Jilunia laotingensis TaxID=2763675 RepID=A0A926F0E0_9BACT|nr:SPOR domain-containing protein [Jilunia laotingensis]MBC8593313.1 SPOR domain-containing protein [Jilunia laotingensis]